MLLFVNLTKLTAQQVASVEGKVLEAKSQKTLSGVLVSVDNTEITATTNQQGAFVLADVPPGIQLINVKFDGYKDLTLSVTLEAGKRLQLGVLVMEEDETAEARLSVITITDNDLADDNGNSETTSGMLQSARDAFQQAAAFNWGQSRFRIRGMNADHGAILINGITMNKLYDGRPQFSNWGGLNDATRNQEFVLGSAASDYSFGGVLGVQSINTRASVYRPGTRVSFSGANTTYNWRSMVTHASGMNKNGWAYVLSASRRWGSQGYFEGVNNSSNAFFASVEKRINDKHSLNLTGIFSDNIRGRNSSNTEEAVNIAGTQYNSYWGWQDGVKRNSRLRQVSEPMLILSHYWQISKKTTLNTNVAYQTGKIGTSRLGYQGVNNPDPTYYRNMPSYYLNYSDSDGDFLGNTPDYMTLAQNAPFNTNRQIDWNYMINANRNTNAGNSLYYFYEDRTDDKLFTANTLFNSQATDNIAINGGVTFKKLSSHNFQNMLDLLGGQYFNDFDNYGTTPGHIQPDLNNPFRKVGNGDEFRYNYYLYANTVDAFTQFKFTYRKVDFYLAQNFGYSEYQREGMYRNGYYPNNSYGLSNKVRYDSYGFKGGMTYKITGQHLLVANAFFQSKAPNLRNVYANARVNDNVTLDVNNEKIGSADLSYIFRAPRFKMRVTGYYSKIQGATEASFFFADGVSIDDGDPATADPTSAFVSETVTNIDKRNVGAEFGLEYQITSTLKLTAAGGYGEFIYDNNPNVRVNVDALASNIKTYPYFDYGQSNMKGYKIAGMPQQAAMIGLEYRDPHFWYISGSANYLGANYLDVAPILRTSYFFTDNTIGGGVPIANVDRNLANQLLQQEKFADAFLFNLNGGYSIKLGKQILGFFASCNNIFDFKYKSGGFEQARNGNYNQLTQDFAVHDYPAFNGQAAYSASNPNFGPKYFYGYGRTYFFNVYLNF